VGVDDFLAQINDGRRRAAEKHSSPTRSEAMPWHEVGRFADGRRVAAPSGPWALMAFASPGTRIGTLTLAWHEVPEPGSAWLVASALLLAARVSRRRSGSAVARSGRGAVILAGLVPGLLAAHVQGAPLVVRDRLAAASTAARAWQKDARLVRVETKNADAQGRSPDWSQVFDPGTSCRCRRLRPRLPRTSQAAVGS
jgi:hypothetical protein